MKNGPMFFATFCRKRTITPSLNPESALNGAIYLNLGAASGRRGAKDASVATVNYWNAAASPRKMGHARSPISHNLLRSGRRPPGPIIPRIDIWFRGMIRADGTATGVGGHRRLRREQRRARRNANIDLLRFISRSCWIIVSLQWNRFVIFVEHTEIPDVFNYTGCSVVKRE